MTSDKPLYVIMMLPPFEGVTVSVSAGLHTILENLAQEERDEPIMVWVRCLTCNLHLDLKHARTHIDETGHVNYEMIAAGQIPKEAKE